MQKLKRGMVALLVAVLFGFGIFLGLQAARWTGLRPRTPGALSTPVLLKQVQSLSELVTVKYIMEKAVVWTDPPQNVLGQFFSGDNRILLLAHGVVKAGVDLSQLKPEDLQVHEKTITLKMPAARITDAYLDDRETHVIERSTGFLRSFDKDLEQTVRKTAVEDIRSAAFRGGITKDADERARTQLASFFMQLGFETVKFE